MFGAEGITWKIAVQKKARPAEEWPSLEDFNGEERNLRSLFLRYKFLSYKY